MLSNAVLLIALLRKAAGDPIFSASLSWTQLSCLLCQDGHPCACCVHVFLDTGVDLQQYIIYFPEFSLVLPNA